MVPALRTKSLGQTVTRKSDSNHCAVCVPPQHCRPPLCSLCPPTALPSPTVQSESPHSTAVPPASQ